jgi:hypothetical protein
MFIKGKKYRLRKKAEVKYESEDEDENKVNKEEEYVNQSEGENKASGNNESEEEDDDETDEVNKKKKYKRKKEEDQKYKRFESIDPNTKEGQRRLNVRRHREKKNMRMLKYFEKIYDKDKYLNHGKYYRSVNRYLREKQIKKKIAVVNHEDNQEENQEENTSSNSRRKS